MEIKNSISENSSFTPGDAKAAKPRYLAEDSVFTTPPCLVTQPGISGVVELSSWDIYIFFFLSHQPVVREGGGGFLAATDKETFFPDLGDKRLPATATV